MSLRTRFRRPARAHLLVERLESRVVLDISINFVGGRGNVVIPPMGAAEEAGVVPRSNWNNAPTNRGFFRGPLVDQDGADIDGSTLTYGSNNTWTISEDQNPPAGNRRMMAGYLDSTDNDTTVVLIAGISGTIKGPYDVYLYFSGDTHNGRHGFYTIVTSGAVDTQRGLDIEEFTGAFVQDEGTGGNYLLWSGVQSDVLLILATAQNPFDPQDNGFRAPINGIQIIDANRAPGGGGHAPIDQVLVDGLAPARWVAPRPADAALPAALPAASAAADALFAAAAPADHAVAAVPAAHDRAGDWLAAVGEELVWMV